MKSTFKEHIITSTTRDVEDYKKTLIRNIPLAIDAWREQMKKPHWTNTNVDTTMEAVKTAATRLVAARNMLSTLTEAFTEIETVSGVNPEIKTVSGVPVPLQGGRKSRRRKKTNQRR